MKTEILGFREEYYWLSNMAKFDEPLTFAGIEYWSAENFYQAMKTIDLVERAYIASLEPKVSKVYWRDKEPREDWHDIRELVMEFIIIVKYDIPKFRELLDDTGDAYIEETNTWKDTFWGVCDGVGQNKLGMMIMKRRNNSW